MKAFLIIIILIIIIYLLSKKKKNIINYEDFDLDKLLKNKSDESIYNDLEKMIESELSKKFNEQINITTSNTSNNNLTKDIKSYLSDKENVGKKTLWETYDDLVNDNSKELKKYDKLENNYSSINSSVYEYGGLKGSLYFDNY